MEEEKLELPEDFEEKLNRAVLLLGAGHSKVFGGYLTNEIFDKMFNLALEKKFKGIKSKLKKYRDETNNGNYEDIYSKFTEGEGKRENEAFLKLLKKIFELMDKDISLTLNKQGTNNLLNGFLRDDKYNFIFTTNHDLLIERYFLASSEGGQANYPDFDTQRNNLDKIIQIHFPYADYKLSNMVKKLNNGTIQSGPEAYAFDKFDHTIRISEEVLPQKGKINFVKLHGSINWEHSEGTNLAITGHYKESEIKKIKVLKKLYSLFEKIMNESKLKIFIIGYSFADEHINKKLKKAPKNGAKLFIIDKMSFSEFENKISEDKTLKDLKESQSVEFYYSGEHGDLFWDKSPDGKERRSYEQQVWKLLCSEVTEK